ncbi:hypothetical protein FGO68_gene4527 [Halteria grandinella]|uniref:Uncharacterized protein n=1 Tax=Halteria grandinella TaxID=5974 RepID=A0A8J8P4Y9_HALGN|nr:hypothetical protein FGO68_gene4527 [Halteria grandinella]
MNTTYNTQISQKSAGLLLQANTSGVNNSLQAQQMLQQFQSADQFDQNAIYKKASYAPAAGGSSAQKQADNSTMLQQQQTISNGIPSIGGMIYHPQASGASEDRSRQNVANNLQGNNSSQQQQQVSSHRIMGGQNNQIAPGPSPGKRGSTSVSNLPQQLSTDKRYAPQAENLEQIEDDGSNYNGEANQEDDPEYAKDFHKAYQRLVEKIYHEQGNTLLISQEEILRFERLKTLNEEEFRARVYEFDHKKRLKIQQMQEENRDKDLVDCTFRPAIYSVEEGYQKRNLDQFLEDQNNFVKKVSKKIEDVKQLAAQQEVGAMHPQIDDVSRFIVETKLAEKREGKPIYERLYQLNQELIEKKMHQREELDNRFRNNESQISITKRENLDQILYEDAERRRKENAKAKAELDRTRDLPTGKPYHNEKSEKYVQKGFDKEYKAVKDEIKQSLGADAKDEDVLLQFKDMLNALTRLGFLPKNKPPENHEVQLTQDLWALMRGEEHGGVSFDTLRILLLNILGLRTRDREPQPSNYGSQVESQQPKTDQHNESSVVVPHSPSDQQQPPASANKRGPKHPIDVSKVCSFSPLGFITLNKGDHKRIFAHFKDFYVHRMQYVGLDTEYRQSKFDSYKPYEEVKEKPEISDKTSRLADKKRTKLLGGVDPSQVTKVDIFLIPKVDQSKIEAKKKELQDREVKDCTFNPVTNNYKNNASKVTHGDRCIDLYSTKQKGWFAGRTEKTMEDYEFERSKEDLKFKPEINNPEQVQRLVTKNFDAKKVDGIRGMDKVRDRMEKARQQQLEKKLMTERGMPSQLQAQVGKLAPQLTFQPQTSKFKSAFETREDKRNFKDSQISFHDSQLIESQQMLPPSPGKQRTTIGAPKNLEMRKAITNRINSQQFATSSSNQDNEQYDPVNQEQQVLQDGEQAQEGGYRAPRQGGSRQRDEQEYLQQQPIYGNGEEAADDFNGNGGENGYEELHHRPDENGAYPVNHSHEEDEEGDRENGRMSLNNEEHYEDGGSLIPDGREPMLYVDVNLGTTGSQRIVVYEGDQAEVLAAEFAQQHKLDAQMREKLTVMLHQQIAGVLEKIDEEQATSSNNSNIE